LHEVFHLWSNQSGCWCRGAIKAAIFAHTVDLDFECDQDAINRLSNSGYESQGCPFSAALP
jgi:phosphoribosyl-AMP cyclohydrolase